MPIVIPIIFAAAFGFGIGYKLKDCLCKKDNSNIPKIHIQDASDTSSKTTSNRKRLNDFSLQSIAKVFSQYNVPLTSSYSFSRLLDVIERETYISLLKHIDQRISTPNELFSFLENEKLDVITFEIANSDGAPYISDDTVNNLIAEKKVDISSLNTIEEKVRFLLILAQGAGTKRFQESFGNDLNAFIDRYQKEENSNSIFVGIKNTVHNRLEFLS